MSHHREVLDVIELCEEQGFRVKRTARGAGGWQVFPKDLKLDPISIYNTASGGSSQTRYLNIRSQLRRIGVVFPELEKKTKEPTVAIQTPDRPIIQIKNVANVPAAAPPEKTDPAAAMQRLQLALEAVQLAVMELELATIAAHAATKPVIAMADLIKQIRG